MATQMSQQELLELQRQREYDANVARQQRLIDAEKNADPMLTARLKQAEKRLAAAQARQSQFQTTYADLLAPPPPTGMSTKQKALYALGAIAAAGAGWFLWKRRRRR